MRTFEEIYRVERPKIYRMLLVKLYPNKEVAEELTDNVFVKVSNHLDNPQKKGNYNPELSAFDTWLFNITKNVLIDYFRTTEFNRCIKTKNIESAVNSVGVEYFQIATHDPTFELTEQTLAIKVENILATIKNKEAVEVAKMRLYGDVSYDEISKELGLTVMNARVMFNRVKAILQNELTSYAM